ncbi:MAG: DUF2214 family protein [Rhodoferax sp.]
MSQLLSYSHLFFAALVLAGPITALVLLQRPLDATTATRLRQVDAINGVAATLVLLIGLVRLFYFGKGPDFYFHNLPFIGKLVLYAVASGLSLVCTLETRRWAAPLKSGSVPVLSPQKLGQMRRALGGQLLCVLGMAACATLAARGIGSI